MNNENKKSISEKVIEAVKSGRVRMRPRWHFVLKAALALVGGLVLALTILYLVSFVFFVLRRTGVWFTPNFGFRGWFVFLRSLPWILILLLATFVVVLETLVRRYSFAYRRPLLYSVAGIAFLVIVGGYAVAVTSFHRDMFRSAERDELLPWAGDFYRGFGHQRFKDIHKGVVDEVVEGKLTIKDERGEALSVVITPETNIAPDADFSKGDWVVVFGDRDDNTVRAFGIREIDADDKL